MKKLQKIKLDELAGIDLNERGLCRILGGGTPGNCQCGCLYAEAGGSKTGANDSANDTGGHYSTTCPPPQEQCPWCPSLNTSACVPTQPQDVPCGGGPILPSICY